VELGAGKVDEEGEGIKMRALAILGVEEDNKRG
jgi:hypothetical protein